MKVPFVGGSSQARSANVSIQRSVNCYLEVDAKNENAPLAMYGTPGLLPRLTFDTYPVRNAIRFNSLYSYWVAGNTVYRVDTSYNATTLGTIDTSTGEVGLASNGTEVLIVDGSSGWLATGASFAEIADVDFPAGVTRAAAQDSYFLVAGDGSGRLYWNETPNTGTAWNGTDYASAEGDPDELLGIISDHREVWLVGSETTEIFINAGDADQLFQRSGSTFLEQGTASGGTVKSMNNTVYWLGAGKDGQGIVFTAQGYNPVRISSHAVEKEFRSYSTIADATAYTYQIDGHSFYVLIFPTANKTWFYDAATTEWFEWVWRDPSDNSENRHRSNCCIFFNEEHLVGDWENGQVYALDFDTYDDDGDPILRLRRTQTMGSSGKRLFFGDLLIDMETGVGTASGQGADPMLMLRYSNDDGHSWSNIRQKSIGQEGETATVVKFGMLGSTKRGKGRVWEISMTDPVKFAVFGAESAVTQGL